MAENDRAAAHACRGYVWLRAFAGVVDKTMNNLFFEKPILNSPYEYPSRHWELDEQGQPTQQIIETRRRAEFITPIPKPKKRKGSAEQSQLLFDEGKGLSSAAQHYDHTAIMTTAFDLPATEPGQSGQAIL